jgi:hypothetical protein
MNRQTPPRPKKLLLDQVREIIRLKHYSIRTEEAYVNWIKRCVWFHNKRHPREMGVAEIEAREASPTWRWIQMLLPPLKIGRPALSSSSIAAY